MTGFWDQSGSTMDEVDGGRLSGKEGHWRLWCWQGVWLGQVMRRQWPSAANTERRRRDILSAGQWGETRLCSLCPLCVCLVKTFMKVTDSEQTRIKTLYWGRVLLEYSSLMSLISTPPFLLWRPRSLRKRKMFLLLSWAYAFCPSP